MGGFYLRGVYLWMYLKMTVVLSVYTNVQLRNSAAVYPRRPHASPQYQEGRSLGPSAAANRARLWQANHNLFDKHIPQRNFP